MGGDGVKEEEVFGVTEKSTHGGTEERSYTEKFGGSVETGRRPAARRSRAGGGGRAANENASECSGRSHSRLFLPTTRACGAAGRRAFSASASKTARYLVSFDLLLRIRVTPFFITGTLKLSSSPTG